MKAETMIRELLNCAELNQDDLEPETRVLIETARQRFGLTNELVVVLRKGMRGDLFALFPEEASNELGTLCTCYDVHGGHCGADYDRCIANSKPARGDEAQRVLDALETIGYDNLRVIERATPAMHQRRMEA